MLRTLSVSAFLLASALPASAQATYSPPGDTLRFREATKFEITVTTPQGDIPVTMENRSTIALHRMRGDSAHAWYEALALSSVSPAGEERPATDSALGKHFRIKMDSRGRTTLLSAPQFPKSFDRMGDLTHQFGDFFLRLPPKPLALGLVWSDTVTSADNRPDRSTTWSSTADYRVERDTVVDGVKAFVVGMTQQIRIRADAPVPDQAMRAETLLEGSDTGFFVFAPGAKRLISRRRSGLLVGNTVMRGGGGEMSMKQAARYTSTMDAVK